MPIRLHSDPESVSLSLVIESPLHTRLQTATARLNFQRLASLTDTSPESVRRYMRGKPPSTQFLTAVCRVLGINAHWLLTGQGPMHVTELRPAALAEADAAELLQALADTLTDLIDRVDRLERMTQRLEALMRGSGVLVESKPVRTKEAHARPAGHADNDAADRIAAAATKRPSQADEPTL